MVEDASLDDFLDTESEDEGGADRADGSAGDAAGADDEGGADADDAVEPAVTTYAWSPEGAACADCGEVVERRWTQDGQLVCGACKSW